MGPNDPQNKNRLIFLVELNRSHEREEEIVSLFLTKVEQMSLVELPKRLQLAY